MKVRVIGIKEKNVEYDKSNSNPCQKIKQDKIK